MSKHRDPKTVMLYDHSLENLGGNFLLAYWE
jgi:hypothetical protein